MNGFQFICEGGNPPLAAVAPGPVPDDPAPTLHFCSHPFSAFTWGAAAGDVFISRHPGRSCLILNGWIGPSNGIATEPSGETLCQSLHARLDRAPDKADFLLRLVPGLQGSFSLIYASVPTAETYAVTDRICSRPVWFVRANGGWSLCSHAVPLARWARASFDRGALASFLLYGCQVDPYQSLYPETRVVEEGAVLRIAADGSSQTTKWHTYRHQPDGSKSLDEWLDLAADRMKQAACAVLATCSKPMIFLSGGLDSRLTAAALCAVGAEPVLVTLGDSVNLEVRTAQKVASALGCPHRTVLRDPHWYLRAIPHAVFESNGAYDWSHAHFAEAIRLMQHEHGVDAVLLGDFGEAFNKLLCSVVGRQTGAWTPEEFLRDFDHLPLPSYRPINRRRTLDLLHADLRAPAEEELRQAISERYRSAMLVSKDARIVGDYFFRWQAAGCGPTFEMLLDVRSAGPERTLMFHPGLHELLEQMPASMRDKANFGARLIRHLHPKAAQVANSNTLLPPCASPVLQAGVKAMRPILGKIRRRFISNSHQTTASWSLKSLLYLNDPVWRSFIHERLSHGRLREAGLFDLRNVERTLSDFYDGDMSLSLDLERLVALSVHLDLVAGDSAAAAPAPPQKLNPKRQSISLCF